MPDGTWTIVETEGTPALFNKKTCNTRRRDVTVGRCSDRQLSSSVKDSPTIRWSMLKA